VESAREVVKTGTWRYGDDVLRLRVVRLSWDLAQFRADYYAKRHLFPHYTDEEFAQEYADDLPAVNDRGQNYVAEFESPVARGHYRGTRSHRSLEEALRYLSEQPYSVV
jgi:hypothetical protein